MSAQTRSRPAIDATFRVARYALDGFHPHPKLIQNRRTPFILKEIA